jgi:hypothetical protein
MWGDPVDTNDVTFVDGIIHCARWGMGEEACFHFDQEMQDTATFSKAFQYLSYTM